VKASGGEKALATEVADLRWERDQLTSAVATKQAILNDLEARTRALAQLKERALKDAAAAQERLQSLQAELNALLAGLPALRTDLAEVVRKAVDLAVEQRIERAVRLGLRRQLSPALRAALANPTEQKP